MLTAGRISYTVGDTFFFDHNDAHVCLQLNQTAYCIDPGKFILLPDAATLMELHRYVQSVLAWREDPSSDHVEHFTTKVDSLLMRQPFRLTSIYCSGHSSLKHVIDRL